MKIQRSLNKALPEQRAINFRSTHSLLARRTRVRKVLSLFLVAFVGLGSLLVAID